MNRRQFITTTAAATTLVAAGISLRSQSRWLVCDDVIATATGPEYFKAYAGDYFHKNLSMKLVGWEKLPAEPFTCHGITGMSDGTVVENKRSNMWLATCEPIDA